MTLTPKRLGIAFAFLVAFLTVCLSGCSEVEPSTLLYEDVDHDLEVAAFEVHLPKGSLATGSQVTAKHYPSSVSLMRALPPDAIVNSKVLQLHVISAQKLASPAHSIRVNFTPRAGVSSSTHALIWSTADDQEMPYLFPVTPSETGAEVSFAFIEVAPVEGLSLTVELAFIALPTEPEPSEITTQSLKHLDFDGALHHKEGLYRLDLAPDTINWPAIRRLCGDPSHLVFDELHAMVRAVPVQHDQTALLAGRKAVVLVHGWQGIAAGTHLLLQASTFTPLAFRVDAHVCSWLMFIQQTAKHPASRDIVLYTYSYNTLQRRLEANAERLYETLATSFSQPVFLVGHSMGGLVSHVMMQRVPGALERVAHIYLLAAPLRGSSFFECFKYTHEQGKQVCAAITSSLPGSALLSELLNQWVGTKELAFERAFGYHACGFLGWGRCVNRANPVLERANSNLKSLDRYTAYAANIVSAYGHVDYSLGVAQYQDRCLTNNGPLFCLGIDTLGFNMYWFNGLRFGDGSVPVESAILAPLQRLSQIKYHNLHNLEALSPFKRVVMVPCQDHESLPKAAQPELRRPPTGQICATGGRYPEQDNTILKRIMQDILSR